VVINLDGDDAYNRGSGQRIVGIVMNSSAGRTLRETGKIRESRRQKNLKDSENPRCRQGRNLVHPEALAMEKGLRKRLMINADGTHRV
jgi:hypothetical protein